MRIRGRRLILVCKNTQLAKMIYEWIAEGTHPLVCRHGHRVVAERRWGYAHDPRRLEGDPRNRYRGPSPTKTAWMRCRLDTVGKRDWRVMIRAGRLSRGFEPLAVRLGRPFMPSRPRRPLHRLGGDADEGWDCNTVTHIVGLRPFMSQLLCEQVVGRGLRRRDYEVGENGKLTEEVARSLCPLRGPPVQQSSKRSAPKPKRFHIQAVRRKCSLRSCFRVEGTSRRSESDRRGLGSGAGRPGQSDEDPRRGAGEGRLPNNQGRPSLLGPGSWRA